MTKCIVESLRATSVDFVENGVIVRWWPTFKNYMWQSEPPPEIAIAYDEPRRKFVLLHCGLEGVRGDGPEWERPLTKLHLATESALMVRDCLHRVLRAYGHNIPPWPAYEDLGKKLTGEIVEEPPKALAAVRGIDLLRAEKHTPYEEYTDGECPVCQADIPHDARYGDSCACGHVFNTTDAAASHEED